MKKKKKKYIWGGSNVFFSFDSTIRKGKEATMENQTLENTGIRNLRAGGTYEKVSFRNVEIAVARRAKKFASDGGGRECC